MLNRLAADADLKTTGNLRFHNIRKWLMSKLSFCGFNMFQIKYVMGESLGASDRVYLQTLEDEIKIKYPSVYNEHLNICYNPLDKFKVLKDVDVNKLLLLLEGIDSGDVVLKKRD